MVVHPHTVCCWLSYCAHEIPDDGRLLFKFVLKIFYGTIVVEGVENIPPRGVPWYEILSATIELSGYSFILAVLSVRTTATR